MQNEPQPNIEQQPAINNGEIVPASNKKLVIAVTLAVIITALITSSVIYAWFSFKKNNTNDVAIVSVTPVPTSLPATVTTTPIVTVQPILQPSITQSSDWKAYNNNNFGFSIDIPTDWTAKELNGIGLSNEFDSVDISSPTTSAFFEVNLRNCSDDDIQTLCAVDAPSSDIGFRYAEESEVIPNNASPINTSNVVWKRYIAVGSFAGEISYQTSYAGKRYIFFVSEKYDQVFQEMIKSFRWIK